MKNGLLTPSQAARVKGITRQAMHEAIRSGRIKTVTRQVSKVFIHPEDLESYEPNRTRQEAGLTRKA